MTDTTGEKERSKLHQLEDAVTEAMRLVKECEQEYADKQGERLAGWWVPLDAMRSEVRRMRGQVEGPLREVKYAGRTGRRSEQLTRELPRLRFRRPQVPSLTASPPRRWLTSRLPWSRSTTTSPSARRWAVPPTWTKTMTDLPLPGCSICGVMPLTKAHICEHGVTPAPTASVSITAEYAVCERIAPGFFAPTGCGECDACKGAGA